MIDIYKKVEAYYGDFCGGYCCWVGILFADLAYCTSCLGAVGVRGNISALKWDGAYIGEAYADGACMDGACVDGACLDRAYTDGAYRGAYCGASCGASYGDFYRNSCGDSWGWSVSSSVLLRFQRKLSFF